MARTPFRITDMKVVGTLAPQTGDVTPPSTPQNIVATAVNAGRVDVSWTASTDDFSVSGYQIFRNGSPLTTTSSTSHSDTTCQPSTAYSYVIVAFDGAGNNSAASNAGVATTPANASPVWQSIPTQTLIVGNSYLLQLTDYCSDADLDTLTFSIPSGTLPTGVVLSGTRLQGTPTTAGQTPTITVRAADAFHQIDTTIAFTTKTVDVTAPPVPTGLSAVAAGSSQINVSWTASTDVAGSANEVVSGTQDYRLYRSTDGTNYSLRATTSSVSYSDTGLSASTQYFYKITARDVALNESAQSSAVNANTAAAASGQQVQNLVVLDDFATWRTANNGVDKYFDIYNGATGDAGPNQTVTGVANSALQITVPSSNVFYVDADCAQYTALNQWLQGHIKSGTWNDSINRISLLLRSTISQSRDTGGSSNFNFGTYTKPRTNLSPGAEGTAPQNGHHYYHGVSTAITANRWLKFVIPNCPDHERGDAGGVDQNVIANYYAEMTRCYFTAWGYYPGNPSSTWQLAAVQLFRVDNEPDNEIRTLTIHYDGTRYRVAWCGRKNVDRTYEIRYRVDGISLRSAGFTSGTNGGTTTNPGNDYVGCGWDSPAMAESVNGIYVGIRVQAASQFHELFLPNNVSPSNTGFIGI